MTDSGAYGGPGAWDRPFPQPGTRALEPGGLLDPDALEAAAGKADVVADRTRRLRVRLADDQAVGADALGQLDEVVTELVDTAATLRSVARWARKRASS